MKGHQMQHLLSLTAMTIVCSAAIINPLVAATITATVTVNGTDMPWNWVNGGLNTNDQFGVNNGAGPVLISAANGFGFNANDILTVTYLSGLVSVGSSFPNTDAKGDTAFPVDNGTGSSGKVFPSFYMNHATYPINLGELVGTFADSAGDIVGTPFVLGDGPTTLTIPTGASRLQLGVNDDLFSDNTGSWSIQVSGTGPAGVPEPDAAALCGSGLVALGLLVALRTTKRC